MNGMFDPYRGIQLFGDWNVHVVQVALPWDHVRAMLPFGLALGRQTLTPEGTHPVRFYFTANLHAQMTWPPGMEMLYHEQTLGIPFVQRVGPALPGADGGPFYYMPRLWLDNWMPSVGGILFWGYEKRMARIEVAPEERDGETWTCYQVRDERNGSPIVVGRWREPDDCAPSAAEGTPHFAPQRQIIDQSLVSQIPWSMGPYLALARFQMAWGCASVCGLEAEVEVHQPYLPGLPVGHYGRCEPLDRQPLGAYALSCPWQLSLAYSADALDWWRMWTSPWQAPEPIARANTPGLPDPRPSA